jgi:threonine/homoserine/homoserine lactone efflux protein
MQPDSHNGDLIFLSIVFLIIGMIYIAPSIVAFRRDHPSRWIILVINLAFGGTIIGWGVALAWALRGPPTRIHGQRRRIRPQPLH